jgi:hypothetical protein
MLDKVDYTHGHIFKRPGYPHTHVRMHAHCFPTAAMIRESALMLRYADIACVVSPYAISQNQQTIRLCIVSVPHKRKKYRNLLWVLSL